MRRVLLLLGLCVGVRETSAQSHPEGPIRGSSIERYQFDAALVVSYRSTEYRHRRPGFDLGIGIIPRWLADGALAGTLDLGAAQAAELGGSLLFLRGGAGALLAAGRDAGLLAPAVQVGLALVVPLDPTTAIRFDLGEHLYLVDRRFAPRWSIGVGVATRKHGS